MSDYTWGPGPGSPYEDNRYLFESEDFMKERIIELLKSTGREGIDKLIEHMEEIGFFEAPCSSQYHLCKVGGLAEHSLNVYEYSMEIASRTKFLTRNGVFDNIPVPFKEITIATLLHDIGKASYHGKPNYIPNILSSGKISDKKPFETNKDQVIADHAYKSCMIASKYIELTEEEEFAILYHNGLYVPSGRDIQGKERPLQQLLHFSDMWCSRFIEKGDE